MTKDLLVIAIIIYIVILVFLSKKIYFWTLDFFARRKLGQLGYSLKDLDFSFEQIDYLVATPTTNSTLCNIAINNYFIEKARISVFNPEIYALEVFVKLDDTKKELLAIVAKDRFPVPILDTLLYYNKIDNRDYKLLISYLFLHPRTHEMLIKEVRRRMIEG